MSKENGMTPEVKPTVVTFHANPKDIKLIEGFMKRNGYVARTEAVKDLVLTGIKTGIEIPQKGGKAKAATA